MTRRYLLDTNIVADLARHPDGVVARHIAEIGNAELAISIVVACELHYGLAKSGSARLRLNMERILAALPTLSLAPPAETHYGDIRSDLERAGMPIGPNDLLIAAHARSLDAVLVTDNVAEFSRVSGLRVENWLRG